MTLQRQRQWRQQFPFITRLRWCKYAFIRSRSLPDSRNYRYLSHGEDTRGTFEDSYLTSTWADGRTYWIPSCQPHSTINWGMEIYMWSDSMIVLSWLRSTKPLQQFIHNRVMEIRDLTAFRSWNCCSTQDNPADLLTRGITSAHYRNDSLWMTGPRWVPDQTQWPSRCDIDSTRYQPWLKNPSITWPH